MNQKLINIAQKIGMDKAIAYSSGARIVQGVTGVLSIFFIASFLSGVEQGFYFTFGSILALQVFFELGLTGIMTQYVAHEVSHLTLNDDGNYSGKELYKSRLASLIRFCIKWYLVLAIIVFVFLLIVGYLFFEEYGKEHSGIVYWKIPWLLICIGTAIKLFQSPLSSIFMGLGMVKEMSKISLYQQITIPLVTWIGLFLGAKLYVVGISYILSCFVWQLYVQKSGLMNILMNLLKVQIDERVSYVKEIFPYQWRIALSWVSGYFIFQLFNPVLFATEGAVVAGQMGMTLSALNAIQAFSMSWLNTKVPIYSHLIALKEYCKLDVLFRKTLNQMAFVCLFLLILMLLFLWLFDFLNLRIKGELVIKRFLPYLAMIIMMVPVLIQQFVSSWATYLRCHKKEPFLANSIVAAVLVCSSTLVLGNIYGLYGIVIGYCIIQILLLPWSYWIYNTKKTEWHK